MALVNYLSIVSIPLVILIIVAQGFRERKNTFDIFQKGAKEGIEIVVNIFPTLIGLFMAINVLRASGIIDLIINIISPILNILKIPSEIMPLAMLRPISGSASMAVGIDIMKTYGVDSKIGMIISTIMGSTETTLYTIAIYTSVINIKKTRGVLKSALIGDIVGILIAVTFWQILM